jgi:hypothetical protein
VVCEICGFGWGDYIWGSLVIDQHFYVTQVDIFSVGDVDYRVGGMRKLRGLGVGAEGRKDLIIFQTSSYL